MGAAASPPADRWLTGRPFRSALDARISAVWDHVELRMILQRIGQEQQIAILLDRRIDPNQTLSVELSGRSVRDVLERIADKCGAAVSVLGDVVYIGPPAAAEKLRTLAELRSAEAFREPTDISGGRQFQLADRRPLTWNDLDRPADILQQIAGRYRLWVEAAEQLPHDLWAGATLPQVDAVEALTLLLVQFDLTFAWQNAGAGIRLEPIPRDVRIERRHSPRNMTPQAAAVQWQSRFTGLSAEPDGREVVVRGTVEQHEAIVELLRPPRPATPRPGSNEPVPLERRVFTLKVQEAPVLAIMQKLEESDIAFRYDAAALKAAGVDLNQRIDLDVKQAPAAELFRAMFEPLKVKFTFEKLTVTLEPRER